MMKSFAIRIVLIILACALAVPAAASAPETEVVSVVVNKSTVIETDIRVTRISLASEGLVDMVLLTPRQIYLTAKELGSTSLTLWSGEKVAKVYDIVVTPDVTRLKRLIHETMPGEDGIRVLSSGSSITLAGTVSSTEQLSRALVLAKAEAKDNVVNLLSVDGIHQVLLEVRVAEMSRSVTKQIGFNFAAIGSNFSIFSLVNSLASYDPTDGILYAGDSVNMMGSYTSGSYSLYGMLNALKANGLVRMLAEPNLTCVSGESAEFLVGGEVPIPMPGSLGTVGIDYKPFGIGLKFTATVLSSGRINLKVNPEVSELDYSRAQPVAGYQIPTISTRRANTVVELGDGQSFMIAGLISDNLRENSNKVPGLGEIPVLGNLFSSQDFASNKTELVVLVTAHLAKPVDMASQTLPTDGFREPDDKEFYIFGLLEGQGGSDSGKTSGKGPAASTQDTVIRPESGFDGEFGHSWIN
ncbi:type II and III secretion system protein family protein [uncultured Pseudodesulfovibrio sp.]|uniref:type II and III secretion system protein family protein n=1 Tax=uncultured Pseudodesulfovibrio sp. TaxID=2035858 RepID=UPI0029C81967|nr:type II and III secretion system protein family protein [uncultured Pseudodesulfovibrio sp.]